MKTILTKQIDSLPCDNPIPVNYSEIPVIEKSDYEKRFHYLRQLMDANSYSHLIIYGDREHFSNLHYMTGLDPRFEEALLIIKKDTKPVLLLGNECYVYANMIRADIDIELFEPFSLIGQPYNKNNKLSDLFKKIGFDNNSRVGVVGWKYYPKHLFDIKADIIDIPHYIIETLRLYTPIDNIKNATDLFNDVNYGVKHQLSAKDIVHFEMAGTKASRSVYNVLKNLKEGMLEIEASAYFNFDGEPIATHPNISFGDFNTGLGVASPLYHQKLKTGDMVAVGVGFRGSLVHKAGMFIKDEREIVKEKSHYIEKIVKPYFSSIVAWYEAIKIGNTYGAVYDLVDDIIGIKEFGITLNPGHLIHTDEWTNSPFQKGNKDVIKSGVAIQCDYTVSFSDPFMSSHVEDGIVVADKELREEIKRISPGCYQRIEKRREFMKDALNIDIADEVLPMSDLSAVCFPYFKDLRTILVASD